MLHFRTVMQMPSYKNLAQQETSKSFSAYIYLLYNDTILNVTMKTRQKDVIYALFTYCYLCIIYIITYLHYSHQQSIMQMLLVLHQTAHHQNLCMRNYCITLLESRRVIIFNNNNGKKRAIKEKCTMELETSIEYLTVSLSEDNLNGTLLLLQTLQCKNLDFNLILQVNSNYYFKF